MAIEFEKLNTDAIIAASQKPPFYNEWSTGSDKPGDLSTNNLTGTYQGKEWLEARGLTDPDYVDVAILANSLSYKGWCMQISPESAIANTASEWVESAAQLTLMSDPNEKLVGTLYFVNNIIDTEENWGRSGIPKVLPKEMIVGLATQLIRFANMTDINQLPEGIKGLLYRGVTRAVLYQNMDHNFVNLLLGSKLDIEKILSDAKDLVTPKS